MRTFALLLLSVLCSAATPEDILGPSLAWNTSPWTGYEVNTKALADTIGPAALYFQPTPGSALSCTFTLNDASPVTATGTCASEIAPLTLTSCTSAEPMVCNIGSVPSWIVDGATVSASISGTGGGCASMSAPSGDPLRIQSHTGSTVTLKTKNSYGVSCTFSSGSLKPQVFVGANPPGGQTAGSARILYVVNSVSGNDVTFYSLGPGAGFTDAMRASTRTGLNIYMCGGLCFGDFEGYSVGFWGVAGFTTGQSNWCHYDPAAALYRMHYRTAGDTHYLDLANQWARACWKWHQSSGLVDNFSAGFGYPGAMLLSTVVLALNGETGVFNSLYSTLSTMYNNNSGYHYPDHNDTRMSGYPLYWYAMLAQADPDSSHHTAYCAMVNDVAPKWVELQSPDGYWYEKNNQYPYRPMEGASPWRMFVMTHALTRAYDSGCLGTTDAANVLSAIELAATWLYSAGFDPTSKNGFYDVGHTVNGLENWTSKAGTITISGSSTTVVGSGTAFLTDFACNGTDYIAPNDGVIGYWPFKVTACADDTHLTVSQAYNTNCITQRYDNSDHTPPIGKVDLCPAAASGASYLHVEAASTSCGTSTATHCYPAAASSLPEFLNEMPYVFGWLYHTTHDAAWITKGDEIFGAAFGTHADGANGSSACAGPNCYVHSSESGYTSGLPSCGVVSNVPPCGSVGTYAAVPTGCGTPNGTTCFYGSAMNYMSRQWAQADGIGGAPAYLYWRTETFGGGSSGGSTVGGRVTVSRKVRF